MATKPLLCKTFDLKDPIMTHQTSWLFDTDECDVQQNEAGKKSAQKWVQCPMAGSSIIRQHVLNRSQA